MPCLTLSTVLFLLDAFSWINTQRHPECAGRRHPETPPATRIYKYEVERGEKGKQNSLSTMKRSEFGDKKMERNRVMWVDCVITWGHVEVQVHDAIDGHVWVHGHAALGICANVHGQCTIKGHVDVPNLDSCLRPCWYGRATQSYPCSSLHAALRRAAPVPLLLHHSCPATCLGSAVELAQ